MPGRQRKVLLIGVDGMDPGIVETMMGKGELPAFGKLAATGYYGRLTTVDPPQSPVVWTSIATGCEPATHGIYDFLHRDPKTYLPYLSILQDNGSRYEPPYKTKTFWEKASENGIPSTVIRWPVTFPPKGVKGNILAGMGVPDIRGTLGVYAFYTTDSRIDDVGRKGKVIHVSVKGNRVVTDLNGPVAMTSRGQKDIAIPLAIEISDGSVQLSVGKTTARIQEGTWSEWIPVKFNIGLAANVRGICKMYLKSIRPEFELYVTPIHVASDSRVFPVSAPYEYAENLMREIGAYATLGMPEEANALNDEVIDEDAFLAHCETLVREREKMLFTELKRFDEGILACVFDTVDRVQHMFWRFMDSTHPMYDANLFEKYGDVIPHYYRSMDRILSAVMNTVTDDTLLMVFSDHGFSSFRKTINLNAWLARNGFMTLGNNSTTCAGLFEDVQWHDTKAYAIGFNSIYINRAGREANGIIPAENMESTKRALVERLVTFSDHGTRVIKNIYDTKELCGGQEDRDRPDLIVSYDSAYRSSGQSAIGEISSGEIIEDNLRKWSGDHCSNAENVPGVIFSNGKIFGKSPYVLDIAPSVIDFLAS